MSKLKRKNLFYFCIILIFIFLFTSLISSYYHFKSNQVIHSSSIEVKLYLESIIDEPAHLSDFLDFEWDTVYVLGPYLPNSNKHRLVGSVWYTNTSYLGYIIDRNFLYDGEILSDGFQELIFTNEDTVVSTALILRSDGDFLHLDQGVFTNSEAKFMIEKDEFFYKKVIIAN